MSTAAGIIFVVVTAGVIAFQVALALGAPWGEYAMGGKFPGRYSSGMRVAALVQAIVLAILALVVVSAAGFAVPALDQALPWLIWLAVAFSAVSVVLNSITPSAGERRIWVPVAVVMLATSLVVALTA
jgi:hypothetical protein